MLKGADLTSVDRVIVDLHDHIIGLTGISDVFDTIRRKGFVYDSRCSEGAVVLFRRLGYTEDRRPYGDV